MLEAPLTTHENDRIAKLNSYKILDTLPEKVYDDVVNIASLICETPIALVSLVDTHRQWFKARIGLETQETPRSVAFCSHAIHSNDIFEVYDSRKDERFHDNPLVNKNPHVIFYAGAPIITPEGYKVGTLCVIDQKPRKLNLNQKKMLISLSRQIAYILEQRIISHDLIFLNKELENANDELAQFSYSASHDLKSPLISIRKLSEFIIQDLNDKQFDEILKNIQRIHFQATQLEKKIEDILSLNQAGFLKNKSLEKFDLKTLVDTIIEKYSLNSSYSNFKVYTDIQTKSSLFDEKNRYLQILESLISNSLNYRDHSKNSSFIKIKAFQEDQTLHLELEDNGVGIPKEYHKSAMEMFKRFHPELSDGSGLGLSIVKKHIERLQGEISFESSYYGTKFFIQIPMKVKT